MVRENGKRNRMRKKTLQSNDATVNGDGRDAVKWWSQPVSFARDTEVRAS